MAYVGFLAVLPPFNPCIFKFLPGNIGGEGESLQPPPRSKPVKPTIFENSPN
jgi:hypothetical protein